MPPDPELVRLMVAAGADPSIVSAAGERPAEVARGLHREEILQLLGS